MHPYLAYEAMLFARDKHKGQFRKYSGNPYADHLAEVAGIVSTVPLSIGWPSLQVVLATAWLHDVYEDQGVTPAGIEPIFGTQVSLGVSWLSDMEEGNRAERKALSRNRLAAAPAWVQTIKCADLISNTSSIVKNDPKFAVTYLAEKRAMLAVLTKADPQLWRLASELAGAL